MQVGPEEHRYRWTGDWLDLPEDQRRRGWAHHAMCVTAAGDVVAFAPADSAVLVIAPDGTVRRSFDCGVVEGHGTTIVVEEGEEYLWIADNGAKMLPSPAADTGYEMRRPHGTGSTVPVNSPTTELTDWRGRVFKIRLRDGATVGDLPVPSHPAYGERPYVPTAVAVAPDGDVWVADGYGAHLLHRFTADGRLVQTLSGEESAAGRLRCPHGLLIDHRREVPELYVADRENLRLVVFGLDGEFHREVAPGQLARPCAMAQHGELLAVAELHARVALLDLDDRIVAELGDAREVAERPGWPNALGDGSSLQRPPLTAGRFNSPHGIASDPSGNLYVTEWLLGGRYLKLETL